MHLFFNDSGMMKKIENIQQLQEERKRLENQQQVLENTILDNWDNLKEGLSPRNIAKEAYSKILTAAFTGNSIIKAGLTYGAGMLVKKLAGKGTSKLASLFKK